ncbi:MAG: hypothetical protein HY738_19410, partial [Bacteroidia bacterium]|nr:hypothetical protein [Bacteroidia bacterium]
FALIPSAGIYICYLISAKGIELYPDDTTKTLSYEELNCLQKTQFSMLAGAELDYYFADRLSVFAEIFYRRYFTSFYKQDFPINPKIQSLGICTGLKYNFR